MATRNVIQTLYLHILTSILTEWVWDCDLCVLDSAFCSSTLRSQFLVILSKITLENTTILPNSCENQLQWAALRGMGMRKFHLDRTDWFCLSSIDSILQNTSRLSHIHAPIDLALHIVKRCPFLSSASIIPVKDMDEKIASFLESVTDLDTLDCTDITHQKFGNSLINSCPDLRTLVGTGDEITPLLFESGKFLRLVCTFCSSLNLKQDLLQSLSITNWHASLDEESFKYLLGNCPCLVELSVNSRLVKDATLTSFFQTHSQLRTLELNSGSITNNALIECGACCPNLTRLGISMCRNVTDHGFISLVRNCTQLKSVDISHTWCTDVGIIELSLHCRSLVFLRAVGTAITDAAIFSMLENSVALKGLRLLETFVTDVTVPRLLQRMHSVRKLRASEKELIFYNEKDCETDMLAVPVLLTLQLLELMKQFCPLLNEVTLLSNEFDGTILQAFLDNFPLIRRLQLHNSPVWTDLDLKIIEKCQQRLVHLTLQSYEISDLCIKTLVASKNNLIHLFLDCNVISNVTLKIIAESGLPLQHFGILGNAYITSIGVIPLLRNFGDLRTLEFNLCTNLDAKFLFFHLRMKRYLRRIHLHQCFSISEVDLKSYLTQVTSQMLGCLDLAFRKIYPV